MSDLRRFEDLHVGLRMRTTPYVPTEDEIVAFARAWDPLPYHVDADAGRTSIFDGLTAAGCHVFSIFIRLTHELDPPVATAALLGLHMKFPHPVRPADELVLTSEVTELRESGSRPECGIAHFLNRLENQRDQTVLEVESALLVSKRA